MTQASTATVRKEIVVAAPIDTAFFVFTERLGDFKPPEHNLLAAPISETVFEPRVGGNVYDIASDGSECRWSRVLAFDPPERVVFSWDINLQWNVETDLDKTPRAEIEAVEKKLVAMKGEQEGSTKRKRRWDVGSAADGNICPNRGESGEWSKEALEAATAPRKPSRWDDAPADADAAILIFEAQFVCSTY